MSKEYGLWTGQEPPLGLVTVRDPRFIPPRHAQVLRNATLDDLASERRRGWKKKHHTSLGSSCALINASDADTNYVEVTYDSADNLGTSWTQEFRFLFPDYMPAADQTIYAKRTSTANTNHLWVYYDQSAGFLTVQFDTASEAVTLVGTTTLVAGTAYSYAIRRDGNTIELIRDNGSATPEDTHTLVAGSGEVNKVNTARWLYGARANNASGEYATDQYARVYLSEHRDWTVARTDAQIDNNYNIELAPSDTTGLRHYRQFRQGVDRRVFRDSRTHIALGNRRDGWARPCGAYFVDRHYPEDCGPWNESTPGIERGERWRRFNGVGTDGTGQEDQIVPNAGQQDIINVLRDGIAKWHKRVEILPERTGTLECIADWALGAASDNPAVRLEKLANDTMRASIFNNSTLETVTTTATVLACTPYAVDIVRRDTELRLVLYRKDTGALVEDVTAVVTTGLGGAVSDGPLTLGRQRNGSNPFLGAIGNLHMAPDITSPRGRRVAPGFLVRQASISIPALRKGDRVADLAADADFLSDCTPTDEDVPDGPVATDCAAGVRTLVKGNFQGLFEYKRSGEPAVIGVQRILIAVFDGVIYEGENPKTGDVDFQAVRRGLSGGRTRLVDWAQHRDQVILGNGVDVNLIRYADGTYARLGVVAPASAPSLAGTTGGSLTQDDDAVYSYFITFKDPAVGGTRSLPSDVATVTLTTGQNQVDLSSIPVSTDPDRPNMHREVWRTKWGISGQGGDYYLVGTIEDNTTTTFSDTTADADLLPTDKIPLTEFGFYYGGLFPKCRYFETFQGRLFAAGDRENPTRLYFSPVNNPQNNPASYWIDLSDKGTGEPITAVVEMWDHLWIFTENDIWMLKSSGRATSFELDRAISGIGATGTWGIAKEHGRMYFVNAGEKRIYEWQGHGQPNYVSWMIEDTMEAYNGDAMRLTFGRYYEPLGGVVFLMSTGTTDDDLEADEGIPENDEAVFFDLNRKQWKVWDWDVAILAFAEDAATDANRLYAGDYMGFVREMDVNDNDGYDQSGDKWGFIDATGTTDTVLNLYNEASLAPTLPTAEDGLMGCTLFLIRPNADGIDVVQDTARIAHNTATQVTLQTALNTTPVGTDKWCIGGIHYRHRTPWLDFDRNIHLKCLQDVTIHYRLEAGNAQDSQARAIFHNYQDGEENTAATALDLTSGEPTSVPDHRIEVSETARFHGFELENFYPDEPCRFEGATLVYVPYGHPVEAR